MTKSGTQGPIGRAKFSNFDFDHFFSRIEPFWVILSKKKFFEKIFEKWLSLEASNHCKASDIQKSQKKVPDFGFNHLFSRIGPFWVIWSNKFFFDFWIIQNFQIPNLKILDDPDFFRENRLARFLPL